MQVLFDLIESIRNDPSIDSFSKIQSHLLKALSALDVRRVTGEITDGIYRQKGNRFREIIEAIVFNRCQFRFDETKLRGYTSTHKVDHFFGFNSTKLDNRVPFIAGETKLAGTPSWMDAGRMRPERIGTVDLEKRTKEIKFTAVDLRLKFAEKSRFSNFEDLLMHGTPRFYAFMGLYMGKIPDGEKINRAISLLEELLKFGISTGVFLFYGSPAQYVEIPVKKELSIDQALIKLCLDHQSLSKIQRYRPLGDIKP